MTNSSARVDGGAMFQGLLSVTHGLNSPCSHCVLPTRWPLFGNWTRGLYKCHGDLQPMRLGRSELGKFRGEPMESRLTSD